MQSLRTMIVTSLCLLPFPVVASAESFVWKTGIVGESYCAQVNADGSEIKTADHARCPTTGLYQAWLWRLHGFNCALKSKTNDRFYFWLDNASCGIPENAYYRWQRSGLGERDFSCVMRVRGNDTLYVYVAPSFCGGG